MGTMQGWVTRNRLRQEQEQAKIEQARKEGFDDGYLAAKVFVVSVAPMIDAQKETDRLQRELKEAVGDAAILAHAYSTDNRPPTNEVIDADPVDESRLSPEAVTRILGIAAGKGIEPDALDKMIGGKLTEAPPSAELEILRQIRVAK